MPLIKVQTSAALNDPAAQVQGLLKTLSAKLAAHLGKPEAYVMTCLEPNHTMTFGGTIEPVCYIEIKNIGTMTPNQTKAMSQDFCTIIEQVLGVPPKRIYLEFTNATGSLWGWNGSTF